MSLEATVLAHLPPPNIVRCTYWYRSARRLLPIFPPPILPPERLLPPILPPERELLRLLAREEGLDGLLGAEGLDRESGQMIRPSISTRDLVGIGVGELGELAALELGLLPLREELPIFPPERELPERLLLPIFPPPILPPERPERLLPIFPPPIFPPERELPEDGLLRLDPLSSSRSSLGESSMHSVGAGVGSSLSTVGGGVGPFATQVILS